MKGRAPTAEQKRFYDLLVTRIGCAASWLDGFEDHSCSIHHIAGRASVKANWLVLPLSAGNHQENTGKPGRIAVHPWKARFEARYGRQEDILVRCIRKLQQQGCDVPAGAFEAVGVAP